MRLNTFFIPAQAPFRVGRLKKRKDFVHVAQNGQKWSSSCLFLQGYKPTQSDQVRVGFTATRRLGKAVIRNRARRRLKACVQCLVHQGFFRSVPFGDYVLISKPRTLTVPFSQLLKTLTKGLEKRL